MIHENVPHFVYRAYDADGVLLYIGCTQNLDQRIGWHKEHSRGGWFEQMVRIDVDDYPSRSAGRAAEKQAIQDEHPTHNAIYRVYEPLGPDACGCLCHGPGTLIWHARKDCCSAPNRPGPRDAA